MGQYRVVSMNQLEEIYAKTHDLDMMHKLEEKERQNSIQYLKAAINGE